MHIILESTKYMRSSDKVMGGILRVEIDTAVITLFVVHKKLLLVFHLNVNNKHTQQQKKAPNSELEEPFPVFRLNQIPQKKTHVFGFSSLPLWCVQSTTIYTISPHTKYNIKLSSHKEIFHK